MEAGTALKSTSPSGKVNSSGGTGNYFVTAKPIVILNLKPAFFSDDQYLCYKNPFLAPIDYIPKF